MGASHARCSAEGISLSEASNHADPFLNAQCVHVDLMLERACLVYDILGFWPKNLLTA